MPRVMLLLCLLIALPAAALEPVTVQLKWTHQFQFAGYYMALHKGFYRQAGLDVTLLANGYNGHFVSPVEAVLNAEADYGISNSGLVRDYAEGKPLVALAATLQHSAVSWLVLERPDIQNLHDLVGKKLMTVFPLSESVELLAPFEAEGINLNQLHLVPTQFDLGPLLRGEVDAFDAYVTNEPFLLQQKGIPYRLIDPRTYGIDFYGDILFTSQREMMLHPERVRAFRQASLQGWRYAMDHVDETIAVILRHYTTDRTPEQLRFEANAMRRLMQPDLIDIGHMNPGRWQRIAELQLGESYADKLQLQNFLYSETEQQGRITGFLHLLIAVSLLAILLMLAVMWFYRLNRRLKTEIAARKLAESQLLNLSMTDPLTGLHNLRYLQQHLQETFEHFHRYRRPFSLLMMDIDFFKRINDEWGHAAGDEVLRQLGSRLQTHLRQCDVLARIGGEEFVLLLLECRQEEACRRAETLRMQICSEPFTITSKTTLTLTVSLGVTEVDLKDQEICDIMARADEALYRAKSLGRNRVECYRIHES
ncbi:diguanylate cyclase [Pseudaeromonas sharmana]|uniref:diguanylate cyclase n=1 Tax=Pseudaeromonas sharmana TaxID=328412 RepID=A0ABV8CMY9_9GAMM